MPSKVTLEMNGHLDEPFTLEEIAEALTQMCPTKAPGPDGLSAAFFLETLADSSEMSD